MAASIDVPAWIEGQNAKTSARFGRFVHFCGHPRICFTPRRPAAWPVRCWCHPRSDWPSDDPILIGHDPVVSAVTGMRRGDVPSRVEIRSAGIAG